MTISCHTTHEVGDKVKAHNCPWTETELENHIHDLKSLWKCWYGYIPPIDNVEITCADSVDVAGHGVGGYAVGSRIRVESMPLKQSAIWHELMHVILHRTEGDSDPNHEKPLPWTLVEMRYRDIDFCPDAAQ